MNSKAKYYLNKDGEFIIENYNYAKPFSSFFPGIAGTWGIPAWVFYVNRGQAIAGFGIKDKDHPIMEFQPANKALADATLSGFRTFIKVKDKGRARPIFYDAFHNGASAVDFDITNKMCISSSGLKLKEINSTLGLEIEVNYFTIPNDNYGALSRKLVIRNTSRKAQELEILDGLPQIIPYGINNFFMKELARTIEAWMETANLENNAPFFHLKVDPSDRPEVVHIKAGNFYLAACEGELLKAIVDPRVVFGEVSDWTYPAAFLQTPRFSYPKNQLTSSQTPSCMNYKKTVLVAGGELVIHSLIGNMDSLEKLRSSVSRIINPDYLLKKEEENARIINDLTENVWTHSSQISFNLYCRQNFLDNVLRGGYPLSLEYGAKYANIQIYSRKHGDLERDYNKFLLEPSYFSQGNGNYRDANQNRRSDIWFNPYVKEDGINTFFNLIQTDGYNPLVLKPDNFVFHGDGVIVEKFFSATDSVKVKNRLKRSFTPGELLSFIEQNNLKFIDSRDEFIKVVVVNSAKILCADHGEGFWIDHWTYCLDLLDTYLKIYPENLRAILLEKKEFTFFDNAEVVRPRKEKYVLRNNRVFQYHAVANNHQKAGMIKKRETFAHISRMQNGSGEIYKTILTVKMLTIIANKFASLDPCGVGVEMEADKPNWYDSLNGLPGLLGSSSCEAFELKRWIIFLLDGLKKSGIDKDYSLKLPSELYDLLNNLQNLLKDVKLSDFDYWDKQESFKEDYRAKTILGFSGEEKELKIADLVVILNSFLVKLDKGLKKAYAQESGLYYSYFINEVSEHEVVNVDADTHFIKPLKFKQTPLPLFLEGEVHYLRVVENEKEARRLYEAVRKSPLFDKKLKSYKVTAPLKEMPEEIGRCRVFTPGWLENESIWLHMEYKYLFELLKSNLVKEFYDNFKEVLIPYQPPQRYGRSILENSSFLVSSAFPDDKLHGNGFVARLSGSTAEFISIWLLMCLGKEPFYLDSTGKLCLEFKPLLASWLFTKSKSGGLDKNTFAFKFLNKTQVVYHNSKMKDTFGPFAAKVKEIVVEFDDESKTVFNSPVIGSPAAQNIREGKASRIDIFLV